ncbi:1-deoxy-D-xylulose-5-phosphate synthase [Parahaliea sp. F7430]|uniref:1-deoxy-D-xylulose-5-phosphate synthase n=1 Tax=Sediminihaliea albiluteola TaxID=2758564 RepID=A0A7W2YHL1_9GAMM|nr:1-deoxy-D-xylulose-5-phosphate synthase [Sediminihaliea albiluteola]MBA6411546.1 1-deoxy-D-xylulose-5-phosphate synthase [Sediminihaliea albiluteola]
MLPEIPTTRPNTPLLSAIDQGRSLKTLNERELLTLSDELRAFLLYTVGQTGGHFGAGMGVVELTIALHYIYNTPHDRIVWDVGHQSYPHKILTGRMQQMHTMRQAGGLAGFPKRAESEFDAFGVGHSSTSISAAMGMALAARQQGIERKAVAVIGDGAITGGMAIEALAHAGHVRPNMLVILNDNQMSIGHNTGGLATYFAKIWASKTYIALREGSKRVLEKIRPAWELAKRTEEHMKGMVAPGTLFEELGFNYIGPLDGHDLPQLIQTLENMKDLEGPQFLHIRTMKGKGFAPAEADPVAYHAINKIEAKPKGPQPALPASGPKKLKYQEVFGRWLCDMAEQDKNLVGITPAMCEGSGMVDFAKRFPKRYYDVAIAEQHAITLAAGMACDGLKPVVAIYSTFLQRGYDQLIHDVALQNLDVTFAIDRAGLVGQDGPTHHGAFDLSFLRCIPNMVIGAPSDENECRQMLYTAYQHKGPSAVRYPRGTGPGAIIANEMSGMEIGKAVTVRRGSQVAILSFGTLLPAALEAAEQLNATVVDMRWVKPLDEELVLSLASTHELLVTLEDNVSAGGAGSAVGEYVNTCSKTCSLLQLGLPDEFIEHASQLEQLYNSGLNSERIIHAVNSHKTSRQSPSITINAAGAGFTT